ncbi:hypothetical protein [Burkholderia sp. BE12]|uniref:hypothetical protein n=1 Tax=Burkholderia sp. BE12 TaxID=2082394 RepID=UPI00131A3646|nr:hypothetical protein [Burkholderia sp. BE12]
MITLCFLCAAACVLIGIGEDDFTGLVFIWAAPYFVLAGTLIALCRSRHAP